MSLSKKQRFNSGWLRSEQTLAAFIFCVTLVLFLTARVHQVSDSNYSMLVSESLVKHRSFTLDKYAIPRYEPTWTGYFRNGPIYQLENVNGHLYYYLPPGTSILSTPYVALLNLVGVSAANPDGTYNRRGEVMIEASLASLLMALLACIFFVTARLLLPTGWSVVVALGGALGTQVYSTASRALWSETWGIFLLGLVVLLLVAHETGRRRFHPVLLASLLSWSYFVRPTFVLPILAITFYVLIFHRRFFLSYALTGAAWFSGFIYYSWSHFGKLLPSYYQASRLQFDNFWIALAGNLVSPARGLLVYVPVIFFVAYLLVRYRHQLTYLRLVWLSLSIVSSHLIIISAFPHWWGGHSFGPRLATGLVPWLVLLSILALDAMLKAAPRATTSESLKGRRIQLVTGGLLLVFSLFINTVGATEHATWLWNQRPLDIDKHPERLWDWRQPQFLAKFLPFPPPREFPDLSTTRTEFSHPEAEKYLWYGWIEAENGSRWADNDAALVFRNSDNNTKVLRLNMSPFLVPGKLDSQLVMVRLNGQPLTTLTLRDPQPQVYSLTLPGGMLRDKNILSFQMPQAQSPQKLGTGEDPRLRSVNLQWMEIQ
jgi:hypothetical protein